MKSKIRVMVIDPIAKNVREEMMPPTLAGVVMLLLSGEALSQMHAATNARSAVRKS